MAKKHHKTIKTPDLMLSDRVLKWVINSVNPQATIKTVNRLPGATSSLIHSISLKIDGLVENFVLRQFNNMGWLSEEPDIVLHEAESLNLAYRAGLPAPQMIAFDKRGVYCGMPAVLMTRIKGDVVLKPKDKNGWLDGLAGALAQIHAVNIDSFRWQYFSYSNIKFFKVPSWTQFPKKWSDAINIIKESKPKTTLCFIHRDYHPTNVLWNKNRVSGIVDWTNACLGPAGVDVGHCRVNLAILYGVPTANAFLLAYQNHAKEKFSYDRYWDILSVFDFLADSFTVYPGWKEFGITGLTKKVMMKRLDDYMISLLESL